MAGFDLGSILSHLKLDTSGFSGAMADARKAMGDLRNEGQKLSQSVGKIADDLFSLGKKAALGAIAAAAAVGEMVRETANLGDELNDMSQRTGIAVEVLSAYRLAAQKAGTTLDGLAFGMRGLANAMQAALIAGSAQAKLFDALDIKVKDAGGGLRPLNDVMLEVADRFRRMSDGAEKAAMAQDLFGRAGMELIPMLNQGSKALAEQAKQAQALGIVFTAQAAKAADRFNDSMMELRAVFTGIRNDIGNALIPTFTNLANGVTEAMTFIRGKIAEFAASGQLREWALATATVFIGAFKLMTRAVEGVLLAIQMIQAAGRGGLAYTQDVLAGIAQKLADISASDGLAGKYKAKFQEMADAARGSAAALRGAADENIQKASDIVEGFDVLFEALDKIKSGFEKVANSAKQAASEGFVPFKNIMVDLSPAIDEAKDSMFSFENLLALTNPVIQSDAEMFAAVAAELERIAHLGLGAAKAIEKVALTTAEKLQTVLSGMSDVVSQGQKNSTIAIENEYNGRLAAINANIKDEDKRQKAILALEAEFQIKRTAMAREAAKQSKAIALMEAVVNTADAITKALAQGGFIFGIPMAAIMAAIGAIQIAVISAQPIPLKEGAAFERPTRIKNAIAGEAGPEYLLPEKKLQRIVRDAMFLPAPGIPAQAMAQAGGKTTIINFSPQVYAIDARGAEYWLRIQARPVLQDMLDHGKLTV